MDPLNLSPGFSARFANIELGQQPRLPARLPRKQYPANLYPAGTPAYTVPSGAPVLSTAQRAASKTLSTPKLQKPGAAPPKRALQRTPALPQHDTQYSPLLGRESKHLRHQDTLFSFMRDTLSLRKKQASTYDRTYPPARAASHPEAYNRRQHYLLLAGKKRQLSKMHRPADITNKFDATKFDKFDTKLNNNVDNAVPVPFADKPTMFSASPSRRLASYTLAKPKEDVYTRLYNSAAKLKRIDETRSLHRNRAAQLPPQPRQAVRKTGSVAEMYAVIYKADPTLFEQTNSLDRTLVANQAYSPEAFINEADGQHLSIYERGEMRRSSSLYYVPRFWNTGESTINISSFKNNYGFDDTSGNYVIRLKDHIAYRYEIQRVLGTGSFGNVVLCIDHKYTSANKVRKVAIKIIKNELDWSLQAVSEIKMLKHLTQSQQPDHLNDYIMNYCDHFHFRGHMCIVTEVLSLNLFTFLETDSFRGVSLGLLKSFAYKILRGMEFLYDKKVIHCDIKPENIMIKLPPDYVPGHSSIVDFGVKIIDFGSSCFDKETSFSYIQSRFYRAPEVILGAKYSYEIDIWSFGCVVAELFTGTPLLPGKTELEQIGLVLEMFGAPSSTHILNERRRLVRSLRNGAHNQNDPLVSDPSFYLPKSRLPIDERKLKKTLLYSLFSHEGKVSLQFLNQQLQAQESSSAAVQTVSPFRKSIKLSTRSLDVALRLLSSNEEKQELTNFSRFMGSIFQWNPQERASIAQLLESPFLG